MENGEVHCSGFFRFLFTAHGWNRLGLLQKRMDRRGRQGWEIARRILPPDSRSRPSIHSGQLPRPAARRDGAGPRTWARRASSAQRGARRMAFADAAHLGGNRKRVRRDAHLQVTFGASQNPDQASFAPRGESRRHDQHRRPAGRIPHFRVEASRTPKKGRAHEGRDQFDLDRNAARMLGTGVQLHGRIRSLLGLHSPFRLRPVLRVFIRFRQRIGASPFCEVAMQP